MGRVIGNLSCKFLMEYKKKACRIQWHEVRPHDPGPKDTGPYDLRLYDPGPKFNIYSL